jgi:hypothetical protein
LILGAAIGIIELIFVHADEAGMGWLMHGLHALPFTVLFTFISMNVDWTLHLLNLPIKSNMLVILGIRAAVAVVAMLKISAAAAIAGRVGERWMHTVIIGVLIFAAPYAWPFIGPLLPFK